MQQNLTKNLQFKADIDFVKPESPCFKSYEYPPKEEFAMSVNKDGSVLTKYGDDSWDFRPFGNPNLMHFEEYDKGNKRLFKQTMYYIIYSHLFPSKYISLRDWYTSLQVIFRACSSSQILASDLNRYPKIIENIAKQAACNIPSRFKKLILYLHLLNKSKADIGFSLINEKNIAVFKRYDPKYIGGQTSYIPSLIWTKLIKHLDMVFDDFETNQTQIKETYHYIAKNQLENQKNGIKATSPFDSSREKGKIKFNGSFQNYLKEHNLLTLLEKYTEPRLQEFETSQFNSYLNNIVFCSYLYVLFYSLMRRREALSLRRDCLVIENDDQLGDFFLLVGETTKTDPDSDDRWVVCNRVARAIKIANILLDWKLEYVTPSKDSLFLFQRVDVWVKSQQNCKVRNFDSCDKLINREGKYFFKNEQLKITQQDYDEALALTPSLARQDWFKVGNIWQFSYHQFRRTLAVHFALNKVSPSSTQLQMKHGTREQQFHYQNNAGKLRLNHLAEQEVVNEYYAEMARNIQSVVHGEAILPHKQSPVKQDVVCFVEEGEMKKLLKAQKNGAVGYRKNLLGGCMKQGTCEYGGFDSITHCAGGTGGNMCSDLIIDGSREQEFEDDKAYYEEQMDEVPEDSPRYGALKAEVRGYEKVLDVIKAKKGGTK